MTCETCGAPTGWVDGGRLTSANESKREVMRVQRQHTGRIAELEQQNAELVAALKLCKFDSLNMSLEDLGFIRSVVAKVKQP